MAGFPARARACAGCSMCVIILGCIIPWYNFYCQVVLIYITTYLCYCKNEPNEHSNIKRKNKMNTNLASRLARNMQWLKKLGKKIQIDAFKNLQHVAGLENEITSLKAQLSNAKSEINALKKSLGFLEKSAGAKTSLVTMPGHFFSDLGDALKGILDFSIEKILPVEDKLKTYDKMTRTRVLNALNCHTGIRSVRDLLSVGGIEYFNSVLHMGEVCKRMILASMNNYGLKFEAAKS